jgi:hypothetical protein
MASTQTIVPSNIEQGDLGFIGADGRLVRFQIVAFAVTDGAATPVTWPSVPSKADVYIRSSAGFQRFDLASGLGHGPQVVSLSEAKQ